MKKAVFIAFAFLASVVPAMAATTLDCMSCHGSTGAKYPVLGAKLGYEVSGHATLGDARYSNATGCQRCHTNEGYVEYVAKFGFSDPAKYDRWANSLNADGTPMVDKAGNAVPVPVVNYPSQPGCFTCHDPHTTGNFLLRSQVSDAKNNITDKPVTLYNNEVYDGGSGNLCASCHMARGNIQKDTIALKGVLGARGSSHHGPEADMVAGTNGFEFAGKSYNSSSHGTVVGNTCVTCHMGQPNARYGFSPEVGGHAFTVVGDVHEVATANLSNCLACHKDVKSIAAKKYINTTFGNLKNTVYFTIKAKADYDGNGKVEFVQQEVQGLLDKLVNLKGNGAMQTMANPMFKADGTFLSSKTTYPTDQLGAYANLLYVIEDKSLGVHNSTYAIELLMDSIQSIDPAFDVSKRP